ncbi:SDR family NAD(P)-dependent oxidoreductase, partial [Kitasatospora sp. NPDC086801]|uniref:SDR family NAD(P)-dependent oxidoreductase n=1 Tax=Kitasatospora sp. NPDC086801 TaxID=3364066 RepID=UPI0037FB0904
GVPVDWPAYFAGSHARHTDLPTYAFQRRRYWLDTTAVPQENTGEPVDAEFWAAVEQEDLADLARRLRVDVTTLDGVVPAMAAWRRRTREHALADSLRYRIAWRSVSTSKATGPGGLWVIAVPASDTAGDMAAEVANGLREYGAEVVLLELSGADRKAFAERLHDALPGRTADGVLSLLALDDEPEPRHPAVTRGSATTLALVQALADLDSTARLWCVTAEAVAVDRGEHVRHPFQASLWGFGLSISLESPSTWGGMVDLPARPGEQEIRLLCAVLSETGGEDAVAVRSRGLFARRLVRAAAGDTPEAVWRPRGTVLVTGGTGGLGVHVARWLAAGGAAHVVLTSRRGPAAEGMAELAKELEALGTRVTIAACDVTDRTAVRRLVDALGDDLTSVVHAAGVMQNLTPASDLTLAEFARIGDAKITGAINLDVVLGDRPLDAFVVFSSGASVWGGAGQSAYGRANAFLDALCAARRARGAAATSIAWSSWRSGMVDEELEALARRVGAPAMEPEMAILALQHALDRGDEQLVVADFDWPRFVPTYTFARPRPLLDALPEVRALLDAAEEPDRSAEPELVQSLAGMSESEQRHLLLRTVLKHVAAVLGYDDVSEIDRTRPFEDLGFDSVAAVELRTRLSTATGHRLPATMVFDHANPTALAEFLRSELGGGREQMVPPILVQLERLEQTASSLSPDEIGRTRIVARLQQLLGRLGSDSKPVAERLADATADDLFDFIDNELGMA